jgi:MFS superfamily sulfate permease-like transporter
VTAITAVISIIMGIAVGWCISSVITSAAVSHSQERMQRKVRYWLAETARARATADELARELAARQGSLPEHEDWPHGP